MFTNDVINRLKEVCKEAIKERNNFIAIRCQEAIIHIEYLQAKLDYNEELFSKLIDRNKKK